jgi:hypothetical protein
MIVLSVVLLLLVNWCVAPRGRARSWGRRSGSASPAGRARWPCRSLPPRPLAPAGSSR